MSQLKHFNVFPPTHLFLISSIVQQMDVDRPDAFGTMKLVGPGEAPELFVRGETVIVLKQCKRTVLL